MVLGNKEFTEYSTLLLNGEIYYETVPFSTKTGKKRTNDTFVCVPSLNIYGDIKSIILIQEDVYLFIHNLYDLDETVKHTGKSLIWLNKKKILNIHF